MVNFTSSRRTTNGRRLPTDKVQIDAIQHGLFGKSWVREVNVVETDVADQRMPWNLFFSAQMLIEIWVNAQKFENACARGPSLTGEEKCPKNGHR